MFRKNTTGVYLSMALNCGIAWTAKQDKQFLFLFFSQKYLIFYLALTVINLLNRSMYKNSYIIFLLCACLYVFILCILLTFFILLIFVIIYFIDNLCLYDMLFEQYVPF